MMRRIAVALLALGVLTCAHAAYDINQLMSDLSTHQGGLARFVEKRHIAMLDKPVQSSGEMVFTPPDRLEKRTLQPRPETVVIDKDVLTFERNHRQYAIFLSSRPEAQAFVESIRSTLSGDRKTLERDYTLRLDGDQKRWVLTLVPNNRSILALLKSITVSGSQNQVQHIEYLQADGDRSEISIEPVTAR